MATLNQLIEIAQRDLGAKVSYVTEYVPNQPSPLDLLNFAVEFAYALECKAKIRNQIANEHRACQPYSSYAQDRADDECRATACLADIADDLVMAMEDALYDAKRKVAS